VAHAHHRRDSPALRARQASGLLDHAYIYGCDENPAGMFPGVERAAALLKKELPVFRS